MRKILFVVLLLLVAYFGKDIPSVFANQTCTGSKITFTGIQKRLLPMGEQYGRPGTCTIPTKIVIHTTMGEPGQTMDDLYNKLTDTNASNTEGVSINFVVDESGKIMQLVEMYDQMSETTRGVHSYNDEKHNEQISIEIMSPRTLNSKSEISPAQYTTTTNLVRELMKQYNIPLGNKEYDWVSSSDDYDPTAGNGVFGHYQLNPKSRFDPGRGFFRDLRNDLKTNNTAPTTNPPAVLTIHNLGLGPTDGNRIELLIKNLYQNKSPMSGHGNEILALAKEYNIDPLIIIIMTNESQMCSDISAVSPPNNYNCGGIIWDTTTGTLSDAEIARWSAKQGPWANDRYFTFVPTIKDGMGLFFNYMGISSEKIFKNKTILEMYEIYNPCKDSEAYGYACGAEHMQVMLDKLKANAGPPSTSGDAFIPVGDSSPKYISSLNTACAITKVGDPKGPVPSCAVNQSGGVTQTNDGIHPTAPEVPDGNYFKAIQDKFGLTFNGYTTQHLTWAWEKLWDVSNTNFPTLVKGVTVEMHPGSQQVNNNLIHVENYADEETFKVVLIHEMGHIIRHRTDKYITEVENAILKEGYITNYALNAGSCTGSDSFNEDYAEMITYYLNRTSVSRTAKCSDGAANPFANNAHSLHFDIAKNILGNY